MSNQLRFSSLKVGDYVTVNFEEGPSAKGVVIAAGETPTFTWWHDSSAVAETVQWIGSIATTAIATLQPTTLGVLFGRGESMLAYLQMSLCIHDAQPPSFPSPRVSLLVRDFSVMRDGNTVANTVLSTVDD